MVAPKSLPRHQVSAVIVDIVVVSLIIRVITGIYLQARQVRERHTC
jgi:uncharacterized protein YneF (UPF0154 family)